MTIIEEIKNNILNNAPKTSELNATEWLKAELRDQTDYIKEDTEEEYYQPPYTSKDSRIAEIDTIISNANIEEMIGYFINNFGVCDAQQLLSERILFDVDTHDYHSSKN